MALQERETELMFYLQQPSIAKAFISENFFPSPLPLPMPFYFFISFELFVNIQQILSSSFSSLFFYLKNVLFSLSFSTPMMPIKKQLGYAEPWPYSLDFTLNERIQEENCIHISRCHGAIELYSKRKNLFNQCLLWSLVHSSKEIFPFSLHNFFPPDKAGGFSFLLPASYERGQRGSPLILILCTWKCWKSHEQGSWKKIWWMWKYDVDLKDFLLKFLFIKNVLA